MKRKISCLDWVTICLVLLAFANLFFLVFRIMRGECEFVDFRARWQESANLFRGINPFDALSGKVVIDEIGVIDPDMVTVPWAWIWGSVISPGFIKYELAKVWGTIFFLGMAVLTSVVCYRYIEKNFIWEKEQKHNRWCLLAFLIVISQYAWVWAFMCGNHGALACCFVVIAVCIYKEHPYLAGIMMTFGMIKPQVAALFFITFLFLKQYRVIITAIVCELLTVIILWGVTGSHIFELLGQTAGVGTNLNAVFYGLFNMLKYGNTSTTVILVLDIVVGVGYLIFHTLVARKYAGESDMHIFSGAAIASTFWFYKQSHDYVILIIPCMALLKDIYDLKEKKYYMELAMLVSFIAIFYVQSFARKVICKIVPSITEFVGKELFMTFTCIVFIALGIIWLRELKKKAAA